MLSCVLLCAVETVEGDQWGCEHGCEGDEQKATAACRGESTLGSRWTSVRCHARQAGAAPGQWSSRRVSALHPSRQQTLREHLVSGQELSLRCVRSLSPSTCVEVCTLTDGSEEAIG